MSLLAVTVDVLSISEQSVDDQLFSVPEGYTKVAPELPPSLVPDRRMGN